MERKPAHHFFSLDILRGLAALIVVFHHWKLLAPPDANGGFPQVPSLVLRGFLHWTGTNGWRAVDLFFVLSGFVFSWLYADVIQRGTTSVRDFFWLRVSRLYPLHLATLLFVTAGQCWMLRHVGAPFVYPISSGLFVLQLSFTSNWALSTQSFNGPVWSVSVEILLYILFFAACRLKAFSVWHRVLYLGAGCCMFTWRPLFPLSAGICFFFAGTLTYFAFQRLSKRRSLLLILGVGLLTFSLLMISENVALHVWKAVFFFRHQAGTISPQAFFDPGRFDLVLFPLLLLTLALWEERRGTLGRRFGFIGNLSYSSYLLHFPLQLVFKIVALSLALPLAIFYSPWTVLLFLLILIPLSLASHRSLELPAQNFLRRKFLRKRAKSVSQAPPV